MTKILACGEGPHDIGTSEWSTSRECHIQQDGWVQPILRKIFGNDIEIETRRLKDIALVPSPKLPGLAGHGRRAALAKFLARMEGCDRVIFVADADTNDPAACAERLQSIITGFEVVQNGVAGTGCVPQSTSESWLLADRAAWQSIAPGAIPHLPARNPEELWGAVDDPASNHPKRVFGRVCTAGLRASDREVRVEVAEATDLAELSRRCPNSVRAFLNGCANPT